MAEERTTRLDPIASLRYSGYLLYLIGSVLSNAGGQMRNVAATWEIYQRARTPLSLGLIGLVLALPVIFLALPAGMLADRYSRRSLIMWAQSGLALCGLGLAWASATHAPLPIMYLLLFGTGVFRALGWPAATAIVVGLVPARIFPNAAMWRSVGYQISFTLGPLLGGLLLSYFTVKDSEAWQIAATPISLLFSPFLGGAISAWSIHSLTFWVYLIDAASSVILIFCLFFVHPAPQEKHAEPHSWKALMDGIRFVRRNPIILSTITLDMVAVLFGGVTALLPIYATDILHVGPTGFGWLRAMPSFGAICMALLLAMSPPFKHAGRTLLFAVAAFGLATIVFGFSRSYPLSLAALFALGAADNISVVVRATVVQLLTPDSMRGRVSAVNVIFIGTSNEIGELESGLAAQWLGLLPAVVGGGVMTLLTVAAVTRIWPELPRLGSLEHLEPAEPVEVTA